MIESYGDSPTQKFVEEGKCKYSGLDIELADQRIAELNSAEKLSDLGALNSVGLHKLHGKLRDFWSIDIGPKWRLVFRFKDGDALEVMILDTHET